MSEFVQEIVVYLNYILPHNTFREGDGSFYSEGFVALVVGSFVIYLSIKLLFDICDKIVKR